MLSNSNPAATCIAFRNDAAPHRLFVAVAVSQAIVAVQVIASTAYNTQRINPHPRARPSRLPFAPEHRVGVQ